MTYQLHHGNMLDILPMMERDSIDAIITDPPYGLEFMGKEWDRLGDIGKISHSGIEQEPGFKGFRLPNYNGSANKKCRTCGKWAWDYPERKCQCDNPDFPDVKAHQARIMQEWHYRWAVEAYRVAKPGAHLLAFGGTRTFHRLACAIEDAGWEIRDTVMWVYGQGFPKSHDVSKAIDREAGAEREVIGRDPYYSAGRQRTIGDGNKYGTAKSEDESAWITQPATPAAQEWDGWGTALKPAWEPIIVARKPLQGTVAENVQRYGTGAMNVDACRIECDSKAKFPVGYSRSRQVAYGQYPDITADEKPSSRWPANLIHDGSAEVLAGFPNVAGPGGFNDPKKKKGGMWAMGNRSVQQYPGDTGSAARFFYCAKASKQDRDEGCEDIGESEALDFIGSGIDGRGNAYETKPRNNHHPTVKPTALMRYLCRLVTPSNGVILDPFMGSGSTGKAAMLEGFNFIGVDLNIEYVEIAARRIEHACEKVGIMVEQPMMFETKRETVDRPKQLILL